MNAGGPINSVPGRIETDRWYDIRLEKTGSRLEGYLDGKLIQSMTLPKVYDFAQVVGVDQKRNELVVKVVNHRSEPQPVRLMVDGGAIADSAVVTVLSGPSLVAENTFEKPALIAPVEKLVTFGKERVYRMPALSLSILRFKLK